MALCFREKENPMTRYRSLLAPIVLLALVPATQAQRAQEFTLVKAVPADVFVYVHGVYNPEHDFLREHWGKVRAAFKKSGVIEDVHTLIGSSLAQPGEREKFENLWKRAGELIDGVDWSARVHEWAYASRMSAPLPEYMVLLRFDEDKAARNAEAFAAVLKEIESAAGGEADGVTYTEQQVHGGTVRSLGFREAPFFNVRVAVRGPIVALAVDRSLVAESFALLADGGDKKALVESERYRQAMANLPPPEDMVAFFDVGAMLDGMKELMKHWGGQAGEDEDAQEVMRVVRKVLDEFAFLDYCASTARTEDFRQETASIVTLAPGAEKSRLYKAFVGPEAVERFDRFIPKNATGYWVSSGIDWSALYAAVLDFIGEEVSGGQGLLAEWEKTQNRIGFHPQRDLFSWLGSEMVSVSLPAAALTPFSSEDSVFMVKVRDEKLAQEKVTAGLDKLNQLLASVQQPLASQPAEIEGAEGFRTVTHPLVALFLRPVYGVAEGYLIIGSSPGAVEACLATARGDRPSVARNERVNREGLIPKGPVTSASFSDMTSLGRNLAGMLGGLGMASAMIPAEQDTKPIKGLIGILGKLAPVAMQLDFFQSKSSVTTFRENAWHTRSVINYKGGEGGVRE